MKRINQAATAKLIKLQLAVHTIRDLRRINLSRKYKPNGHCIDRPTDYLSGDYHRLLLCSLSDLHGCRLPSVSVLTQDSINRVTATFSDQTQKITGTLLWVRYLQGWPTLMRQRGQSILQCPSGALEMGKAWRGSTHWCYHNPGRVISFGEKPRAAPRSWIAFLFGLMQETLFTKRSDCHIQQTSEELLLSTSIKYI